MAELEARLHEYLILLWYEPIIVHKVIDLLLLLKIIQDCMLWSSNLNQVIFAVSIWITLLGILNLDSILPCFLIEPIFEWNCFKLSCGVLILYVWKIKLTVDNAVFVNPKN